MRAQSFSDLSFYEDISPIYAPSNNGLRPFWALANDKTLLGEERTNEELKWYNDAVDTYLQWKYPITRTQRCNIKLYKGIHYISQELFEALPYNRDRQYSKNNAKITINKLQLLTDQHVADTVSYAPSIKIIPTNNEETDKVAARQNQGLLDFYDYKYKMGMKWQKFHLRKKICGTSYLFILWNEEVGDLHPSYVQFRKMREMMGVDPHAPIPLIDPETGAPIVGDGGDELFIDRAIRVGDVDCQLEFDERVLHPFPDSGEWEDVEHLFRLVSMDIDEVKARWPASWEKIARGQDMSNPYNTQPEWYPTTQNSLTKKIWLRYFWHKPTAFLDRGYYSVSTRDALLEAGPYPYKHNRLPVVRGTDIDVPGSVLAMSFFQNLVPLQFAINNQASMFLQDQLTMTYPKIVVPRGARVKPIKLGDDRDIYEYSGPKPPEIMSKNPTPTQSWQYYQLMNDELKMLSAVFGQSVGQPPNGITANVALRMLDEQEQKLRGPALKKNESYYIEAAQQLMSLFGSYYDPEDGRLARILGANDAYTLMQFDIANLSTPYEVTAEKMSGLPKSPAAKTQLVLDLAERFPNLFGNDEVLEQLDIARPEKLVESATVARQCAEAEVDAILQGKFEMVLPPAESDEILPKYKVYIKAIQPQSFKLGTPPDRQQRLLAQIMTAEYIIWKKIQNNPLFGQIVQQECPNFPAFFPLPKPSMPMVLNMPSKMMAMAAMGAGPNAAPAGGIPPEMAAAGAPMPPGQPEPAIPNPSEQAEPMPPSDQLM